MTISELLHQFPETDKQREIFIHKVRELCEHGDAKEVYSRLLSIQNLMEVMTEDTIIIHATNR